MLSCIASMHVRADTFVLHDVKLIDGRGGAPRLHQDIVIADGRIRAIRPASGRPSLEGHATMVDLSGKSVMPGLISDHSHVGLTDGISAGGQNATEVNMLRQLRQYEAWGVTTVMSLGLNQQSFYDLAPKMHAGAIPGADLFGADRGFGVADGAPPAAMGISDAQVYRPASEEEARAQVRETAQRHPELIKIWVDDFHGQVPVKVDPAIYRAIIDEAHAHGIRVAAHVFYLDDAKRLLDDGVDILAHGVRDRPVDAEFIASIKAHHAWYIPTLGLDESFYLFAEHPDMIARNPLHAVLQPALASQLSDPAWRAKVLGDTEKLATDRASFAVNLKNAKVLYDSGVQMGFGTDSGATSLRIAGFAEHHELTLLVRAGLTPLQALRVATRDAAALLRLDDRGVIAMGKWADLIVIDGDPSRRIEDIDRVAAIWHRGRLVTVGD